MLLQLRNIRKQRGEDYALRINQLTAKPGEYIAITGPSGCGKSTSLDLVGMVLDPDPCGEFIFSPNGKNYDIAAIWRDGLESSLTELRRNHIGYILQTGEIFAFLNVRANIELTALVGGLDRKSAFERASDLLERLELAKLANAMPATLSIGQRQRAAIARALAPNPALLLADEPTSALDPVLARKVMRLLLETIREYGTTLIMVSHDLALVSEFGFRNTSITMQGNEAILDERK